MNVDHEILELFFSRSPDGFFIMMIDEPVPWDESVDKEQVLDYVFAHQRITKVNDAMLAQYGTTREKLLGLTPADLYRQDIYQGRVVWRELFDRGLLHVGTFERRIDGSPIALEADYICFRDDEDRILGHFGVQRDVTERKERERGIELRADEAQRRRQEIEEALGKEIARLREELEAARNQDAPEEGFRTLPDVERSHILEALERTGGVIGGPKGAARLLGVPPSTLSSRMRKLGVESGKKDGSQAAAHPEGPDGVPPGEHSG